jgi:hypothetical protein
LAYVVHDDSEYTGGALCFIAVTSYYSEII